MVDQIEPAKCQACQVLVGGLGRPDMIRGYIEILSHFSVPHPSKANKVTQDLIRITSESSERIMTDPLE